MIKETLYYKNNYLKEFETVIDSCIEENGKIKVVLKETAFYPEGGGQPADIGFIDGIKVLDVREKENIIYHILEKRIEEGKKVSCKIDFKERLSNMQSHTAEHIVSGIICKKFNTSNVGFHIGKDVVTMDFATSITEDELREIEKEANYAVYKNLDVIINVYSKEEAQKIDYRSKKELNEDIRIVEISGYDRCACCGVHVSKTGEIGIIKLLKVENYKSGVRIYMLAGEKAIEDYTEKYDQVNKISTLLSLKLNEVYIGVAHQLEEIENLKKEKAILKNTIMENEISKFENQRNIILEKENMEMNDMKNYCTKLKTKASNISGVISNGKFILMSDTCDLKEVFNNIKQSVNVKGGGNNLLVQGQLLDDAQKLKEIINNF